MSFSKCIRIGTGHGADNLERVAKTTRADESNVTVSGRNLTDASKTTNSSRTWKLAKVPMAFRKRNSVRRTLLAN